MGETKVIAFPKDRIVRDNSNHETVLKMKERGAQTFADYIVEDIVEEQVTALASYGVDIEEEQFIKDFSVTVDTFKASIYRTLGIKHRLHNFIDKHAKIIESDHKDAD